MDTFAIIIIMEPSHVVVQFFFIYFGLTHPPETINLLSYRYTKFFYQRELFLWLTGRKYVVDWLWFVWKETYNNHGPATPSFNVAQ